MSASELAIWFLAGTIVGYFAIHYITQQESNVTVTKVLATGDRLGDRTCIFSVNNNQTRDFDYCKTGIVGDTITVYEDPFGTWRIKQ